MSKPQSRDPLRHELANAVLSDLEREVCGECDGTGQVCLVCELSVTECTCGPDAEPSNCDVCLGEGSVFTEAPDEP